MSRVLVSRGTALLALVLVSLAPPSDAGAQDATRIASGLAAPIFATAPVGDSRLFIVERNGRILIYTATQGILPAPFLDYRSVSGNCAAPDCPNTNGEGGLLGLAFSPTYESDGFFYVYYTTGNPFASRITRFSVGPNPDIADPTTATVVWTTPQPATNHNGGTLAFHPTNGLLYLATGDGGGAAARDNSQDDDSELGKVLRFDLSQFNPPAQLAPEFPYYAKGLRNPFRWSFDRATGDMYLGDVGEQVREEINVLPDGSAAGINFGWPIMEGSECFGGGMACDMTGLTLPVVEYDHAQDMVQSVTGGSVYRGPPIPALADGEYLHTDYANPFMNVIAWPSSNTPVDTGIQPDAGSFNSLVAISEGGSGALYIVDLDGEVFRVPETRAKPAAAFAVLALLLLSWLRGASASPAMRRAHRVLQSSASSNAWASR